MNYYERHLGDYARDTAHLSLLEHGVYTLLLDRYYATEAPIPANQAHRLARARTDDERASVDAVLGEFFVLVNGAWTHRRAEEEIVKTAARIAAAKENGKRGGRPKKNPEETQKKPSGLSVGSENITQHEPSEKLTKLHTPDTTKEKAEAKADAASAKRGTRLPVDWTPSSSLMAWASGEHPGVLALRELAKFRDHWRAKPGAGGLKLDWEATFRNWIRTADTRGETHANHSTGRRLSAVEQVEQAISDRHRAEGGEHESRYPRLA